MDEYLRNFLFNKSVDINAPEYSHKVYLDPDSCYNGREKRWFYGSPTRDLIKNYILDSDYNRATWTPFPRK